MVFEKVLIKKFNIKKEKGWRYNSHVNKIHKLGEWSILVVFLISIIYVNPQKLAYYILLPYYIVMISFRAFMEWKYQREKRKYILTLSVLFFIVLGFICLYLFRII
ncbi:DUF4181 domain-containing protein [Peribacillus loiseleuriae]|uniref:DUF4181 domain-containing protein n=1 Tax=Peribacillus loiseleuriae TaxID=1679170 RepID=UPI003D0131C9